MLLFKNTLVILSMFTVVILDCDGGYIWWHSHMIAKPSLVSRVKGQADIEHSNILSDIVIYSGYTEGELTHATTKWAQTEVVEATIVTGS